MVIPPLFLQVMFDFEDMIVCLLLSCIASGVFERLCDITDLISSCNVILAAEHRKNLISMWETQKVTLFITTATEMFHPNYVITMETHQFFGVSCTKSALISIAKHMAEHRQGAA